MTTDKDVKKFSAVMRDMINKYELRNVSIANELEVSSQYISKILNGKCLPSREQLDKILQFLERNKVPIQEQRLLISSYVEDKTGFFYEIADLEFTARNPTEKKLINDFRMLNMENQKKVLFYINELLIQAL